MRPWVCVAVLDPLGVSVVERQHSNGIGFVLANGVRNQQSDYGGTTETCAAMCGLATTPDSHRPTDGAPSEVPLSVSDRGTFCLTGVRKRTAGRAGTGPMPRRSAESG